MVKKMIDDPDKIHKIYWWSPKEIIKHIQQPATVGYKNERSFLEEKYGDPHQIVAAYCEEIKSWDNLKTSR